MSSTYNSTSTPASLLHSLREDDIGLDKHQFPFAPSQLSPSNYPQTISNSASPSYNTDNSTPGESLSEYNYQQSELSEFDDPFFGVDFDAGVHRIDSLPSGLSTGLSNPAGTNRISTDLPSHLEEKQSSETLSASTYPISPRLTSTPNTPSPRSEIIDTKFKPIISQYELPAELHNSQFPAFDPNITIHPSAVQLTPDRSESSDTSAEGVPARTMTAYNHSPRLTVSQFGDQGQQPPTFAQTFGYTGSENNPGAFSQYPTQPARPGPELSAERDEEGVWRSSDATGQAGLDPEKRAMMGDNEVLNFKDQEERIKLEQTNIQVESWRSQAGGSDDGEDQDPNSYFQFNQQSWDQDSHRHNQPDEANNIAPVDDAASIRENTWAEGQAYYDVKDAKPTATDLEIMKQSRHWSDAPMYPNKTETSFQPPTANEAMKRWNVNAETMSLASRAATWGTHRRRRSEPSVADIEAVTDGSIFKKIAIAKKEAVRNRQNSIFDQGLDRLANIVRSRGNSNTNSAALKRARSTQNVSEATRDSSESARHNSQGTLAPPGHRQSLYSRKQTPSINTAFAAMTGPLAAVGATHTHNRGGSVSGANTSPKISPTHLGLFDSMMGRRRTKSELSAQDRAKPGLVGLLRAQGGPPVANLASPPVEAEPRQPQSEVHDQDDEEEEDDEQMDEGDIKIEAQQEPIVPNYEGFKAHVRRLNPEMESRYSWLVSRIAHQQEIRYKNLLDLRVKHQQAIIVRSCTAGRHCLSLGGTTVLLDAKGNPREPDQGSSTLQLVTNFSEDVSDDSNPGEGALTDETFPSGVPMPPSRNLPAEFECQLCFKAKKFQKPSDWTKHVHEDVQPFTCTYDKCKEPKSFKRKADWVRHENERHRHLEWWICQVEDCRHPCYRKDNFLQHLVREHKLPEPKQKTKAAIKKARTTEPAWIMLERCHHQTLNRPQDEHCKFCGKSFNTWKKLTVHLAKHMEHISLPILQLVEVRNIDANTIISPVEQILTPVTPGNRGKMEGSSPFNMDNVSQFTSGYEQPTYYPSSGVAAPYGMPAPIQHEVSYNPNPMYAPYGVPQMVESRSFNAMETNNLDTMTQSRGFGSIDSSFSHTKVDQSRGYGSMDSENYNNLHDAAYNAVPSQGYALPHTYATSAPLVQGYQASNMLGISDAGYAYDSTAMHGGQNYQQVPMSRSQGSAPSYSQSHSPEIVPQNVTYYGHQ
jgi:hypothetical protein